MFAECAIHAMHIPDKISEILDVSVDFGIVFNNLIAEVGLLDQNPWNCDLIIAILLLYNHSKCFTA